MVEIWGLLMIANISIVVAYFTEYMWSLFLYSSRLEAEVVDFEQRKENSGWGMRENFYTLIYFRISNIPHTILIRRDRGDFIGKRINISYSEKKNTILRNHVRRTYCLDSRIVQVSFYVIYLIFIVGDLGFQLTSFQYVDEGYYMSLGIIAVLTVVISFKLACMYISWTQKRLNS